LTARILVVDDDAAIRSTLAEVLAEDGAAEVDVAASAEEAIRVLDASAAPDLVLSDIRMRGLDGMDLKLLRREVALSLGVDRFLEEIRIAARLHHPHILTLIDSGELNGAPYFVMPFVAGLSLRRWLLEHRRMPAAVAAALLRDVADALAAAHTAGIVHRDVKPENVLLSGQHAWVADFGVAKALGGAAAVGSTLTGTMIGTPLYMAPEQGYGDDGVDGRADIYALGVVAYELLCGEPPFNGTNATAVLAAHLTAEAPPPRARRPDIPSGLEDVVMKCLAKDPRHRWPDAASLARGFGSFAVEAGS
jgi:serine/threonine-protein kinase